jgi:apolipoprotein N-acyltransferase
LQIGCRRRLRDVRACCDQRGIAEAPQAHLTRFAGGAGALVLGAVIAASAYGYGQARLSAVSAESGASVPIAIVQANLDLGSQWREEMYGANLAEYLELTDRILHEHRPRIRTVFWPENSMTFFVDKERLSNSNRPSACPTWSSWPARRFRARQPAYFNPSRLSSRRQISARYDKRRLMPFAEYFPRHIDLRRSFGRVRLRAATRSRRCRAVGKLGIICNEAIIRTMPLPARARAQSCSYRTTRGSKEASSQRTS